MFSSETNSIPHAAYTGPPALPSRAEGAEGTVGKVDSLSRRVVVRPAHEMSRRQILQGLRVYPFSGRSASPQLQREQRVLLHTRSRHSLSVPVAREAGSDNPWNFEPCSMETRFRRGWSSIAAPDHPDALDLEHMQSKEREKADDFGAAIVKDDNYAWYTAAGSISWLVINTCSFLGTTNMDERRPRLSNVLFYSALAAHMLNCAYPLSAAFMSADDLKRSAQLGHEYSNTAIQLGNLTGLSPHTVAVGYAIGWGAIVPIGALYYYYSNKAHAMEVVSDPLAFQHWLAKALKEGTDESKELKELYEKYDEKEKLQDFLKNPPPRIGVLEKNIWIRFSHYLMENIAKEKLSKAKKEILHEWESNQKSNPLEKTLFVLSIIATVAALALNIIAALAFTFAPGLSPFLEVGKYLSPALMGFSIITTGYNYIKDKMSPDRQVPNEVKRASLYMLITSVIGVASFVLPLFIPGLNTLCTVIFTITSIASIYFTCKHTSVLRRNFELLQAIDRTSWNFMISLMRERKASHEKFSKILENWILLVQEASKKRLLDDLQKEEWAELGGDRVVVLSDQNQKARLEHSLHLKAE